MTELKIDTASVAAVNDQLKNAERELLSTDQRKHMDGIRRLHSCIENLTKMILHSVEKVKVSKSEPEICVCGHEKFKDHYPAPMLGTLPCEVCDCKDFKEDVPKQQPKVAGPEPAHTGEPAGVHTPTLVKQRDSQPAPQQPLPHRDEVARRLREAGIEPAPQLPAPTHLKARDISDPLWPAPVQGQPAPCGVRLTCVGCAKFASGCEYLEERPRYQLERDFEAADEILKVLSEPWKLEDAFTWDQVFGKPATQQPLCECGHPQNFHQDNTNVCASCDCDQYAPVQGTTARDIYLECSYCGRRKMCGDRHPPWRKRRASHCQGFAPVPAQGQPRCVCGHEKSAHNEFNTREITTYCKHCACSEYKEQPCEGER